MSQRFTQENEHPMAWITGLSRLNRGQTSDFTRFSLRTTIMFWFLAISLIPVVFVSLVGYHNAVQNRIEDYSLRLLTSSLLEKQELEAEFRNLHDWMAQEALALRTGEMLATLEANPGMGKPSWEGARHLKAFQDETGVHDILLTNHRGEIVFSSKSAQNLGTNLLSDEVIDPVLRIAIRHAFESGKTSFTGFKKRLHKHNLSLGYHVEPVKDLSGHTKGLLVMELGTAALQAGLGRKTQLETGTVSYVVDENLQLLFAWDESPAVQGVGNLVNVPEILNWQHHLKVSGKPESWENSFHNVKEYTGLNGQRVLGVIQDINILGSTFALARELPRVGVLAGLKSMGFSLLLTILLVAILVVLAGLVVAQRMVHPINQLGQVMQRVADGHEVWTLPRNGPKEVSQLTQMFHSMINKLNDAQEVNERQYAQKRRQFEFNEKLRSESTLESLSEAVLQYLGEYFGAQLGVFYLVKSRDIYAMAAHFGMPEEANTIADVHRGKGVLGRVVEQKKIQVLRGIQDDRHKVETGLVSSFVNTLVVAPIYFGDRVLALLEFGLMEDAKDEDLEFLALVSETVAVAINSARSSERVHRLLKETWSQTAALSKQQKDLQETNRRFELADQYKSEFLANMSHELRTPLNSLLIMSQVLAENRNDNLSREEVDSAMTINRAGSDLLLLINDILDLSKVEAGKLDLQFSKFELKPLLMDMEDLFAPLADRQELDFRTVLGPDLPAVMVSDPLRLTQILKNILNNAFKFTEKGSVTFRVRIPGASELDQLKITTDEPILVFSVSDTGVGISNETLKNIFDAFNQGDGSIGRRYGGSGLGLSISKRLCELLGGEIHVESIEGHGSTFSLYLALNPSAETTLQAEPENLDLPQKVSGDVGLGLEFDSDHEISSGMQETNSSSASGPHPIDLLNRRVLICEDDMRTVFQISEVLDDLGADVTLAPSWAQGVSEGKKDHGFDFAIVSSCLADRPGPNSVQTWKQECGDFPNPVVSLLTKEEGPRCEGSDLVGRRPLVRDEFIELIGKALAMEKIPLQQ